jgi:hypothetical protein
MSRRGFHLRNFELDVSFAQLTFPENRPLHFPGTKDIQKNKHFIAK